jgi:hypothetical protein
VKKGYGDKSQDLYTEVKAKGRMTVGQLWKAISPNRPGLAFEDFLKELQTAQSRGVLRMEEPPIATFRDYVKSWRYGFRGLLTALSVIASLPIVELLQASFPWVAIRWVAGTFLILIAPGYTFTWTLFPSREKTAGLNRLALTIAMSLFLVPATGLLLNYTPFGIRPEPIAAILAVLSLLFLYAGMHREFAILSENM